ncbi:hypothetical protein QBC45DRAFT_96845 [Copromyces sp. CBS 386.78]|nr:hypothetical protein QBC45DRAFT_96845 [Copromyces sp. CBS 386.78]
MASTSTSPATAFDEAQGRTELRGIPWHNEDFPKNVFDPEEIGETCRIMCYPQKSMRSWPKKYRAGPTVVIIFEFPQAHLAKLHCVLQLICAPVSGHEEVVSTGSSEEISARLATVPEKENDPPARSGWARVMVWWPCYVTGFSGLVDELNGTVGKSHFLKATFRYGDDKIEVFKQSGPTFLITDDESTKVKQDATGMIADKRDLGWFNMANLRVVYIRSVRKKIIMDHLNNLPGTEPLECFGEPYAPANSVASGSKGVDIKRPPYLGAMQFVEPPRRPADDPMLRVWREGCLSVDDEDYRHVEEYPSSPSEYYVSLVGSSDEEPESPIRVSFSIPPSSEGE